MALLVKEHGSSVCFASPFFQWYYKTDILLTETSDFLKQIFFSQIIKFRVIIEMIGCFLSWNRSFVNLVKSCNRLPFISFQPISNKVSGFAVDHILFGPSLQELRPCVNLVRSCGQKFCSVFDRFSTNFQGIDNNNLMLYILFGL